jgi:hypothetical protein
MSTDWKLLPPAQADAGRKAAKAWLTAHFDAIGQQGTMDLNGPAPPNLA